MHHIQQQYLDSEKRLQQIQQTYHNEVQHIHRKFDQQNISEEEYLQECQQLENHLGYNEAFEQKCQAQKALFAWAQDVTSQLIQIHAHEVPTELKSTVDNIWNYPPPYRLEKKLTHLAMKLQVSPLSTTLLQNETTE